MKIQTFSPRQQSDFADLPDNVFEGFRPVDEQVESVSDALQKQLTFGENMQAEPRTIQMRHDVAVTIELQTLKVKPTLAWIAATGVFDYARLAWQAVDTNRVQVKVKWDTDPGEPTDVTIVMVGS